jgi:hypothetical protein
MFCVKAAFAIFLAKSMRIVKVLRMYNHTNIKSTELDIYVCWETGAGLSQV